MTILVSKADEQTLQEKAVLSWPIWQCDVSSFEWTYAEQETCYLLEGEVTVTSDTQTLSFGAGDMVVFPAGLSCVWQVTKVVKKHYQFA